MMYYCKRCRVAQEPMVDPARPGRDKVRGMRSGFVARYLTCGHSVAVTQEPVNELLSAQINFAHREAQHENF